MVPATLRLRRREICCFTCGRVAWTSVSSSPDCSQTGSLATRTSSTKFTGSSTSTSAAILGDEESDFAGGSYVIVQKYLHDDLTRWETFPVEERQRVVGRTELNDVELADDVKPAN